MSDLISVIVPVYNVEEYLRECIESIISQTYSNLEIILIDDGSKDQSGMICDEYEKKDSRIKVIHKENAGVSSARNTGLQIATGDWVAFVDSDDWLEENYFEVLINAAKTNNVEVVLCGYNRVVLSNKESINNSEKTIVLNSRAFLIKILNPQTGYGFCHMKLYKKEVIKDILFDANLIVGEDALFNEQIAYNVKKVCMIEKSLYNYRINLNSAVKKYDPEYANKYLKSMKVNKEYLMNNYSGDKEIIQNYYNYVAFHVLLIAVNYCYNKQNKTKNKSKLMKEICGCGEFKEGIQKSNYKSLSLTRKIAMFTIKHRMFFLTSLICGIRNNQNKVEKGDR